MNTGFTFTWQQYISLSIKLNDISFQIKNSRLPIRFCVFSQVRVQDNRHPEKSEVLGWELSAIFLSPPDLQEEYTGWHCEVKNYTIK